MKFNCAKCPGYCCSHGRIAVSDYDISRLARFFGISARLARRRLSYRYRAGDVDEYILRHHKDHIYKSVCRFLDRETRRCTVYDGSSQRVPKISLWQCLRLLRFSRLRAHSPGRRGFRSDRLRAPTLKPSGRRWGRTSMCQSWCSSRISDNADSTAPLTSCATRPRRARRSRFRRRVAHGRLGPDGGFPNSGHSQP